LRLTVAESVKISVTLLVENEAKLNATDNRKDRLLFPLTRHSGAPQSGEPGIHGSAEYAARWIPGPRHPSRLLPTWTIMIAELG
jgi:hypothetical protein